MGMDIEKVLEVMQGIALEGKLPREVSGVIYREDYQDYQVIIADDYHCEIREKLFNDFVQLKHVDARREIVYLMQNAVLFEEWERPDTGQQGGSSGGGGGQGEGKIVVDDSDKYDF